jgi:hypothetical protein
MSGYSQYDDVRTREDASELGGVYDNHFLLMILCSNFSWQHVRRFSGAWWLDHLRGASAA